MKTNWIFHLVVVLFITNFALASDFDWRDVGIGDPFPAGSHQWDGTILTIAGSGKGLGVSDNLRFVYISRAAGDFQIVARLTGLVGEGDGVAGIMARSDHSPTGSVTAVSYKAKNNDLTWHTRLPAGNSGQQARSINSGVRLAQQPPVWMKMVRMGKNFAVYKSYDGKLWSMLSNNSGGPCAFDGAVEVGFFVAGGAQGNTVTASFDSIAIGAANMPYRTSWVGNTFGCRDNDSHVSNGLSAMWVAPDGTCYTSSYWDEGGQPVTSYRDGKVARPLPIGTPQTNEGGITGDDKHIFVATVDYITELDPAVPDFAPDRLCFSVNLLDRKSNQCVVSGLASNGKELFLADSRDNLIRVATVSPVKTYQVAGAANDMIVTAPAKVSVPDGDTPYAPAAVYQTQRIGEGFRYTLPGFVPGDTYTVRCHLAEYVDRPANCDPRNRLREVDGVTVNVAELAGGVLKAAIKDFPGYKADAKGNVIVNSGSYGGPGLCGLEVLDAAGKRVLAINCGGPAVGDFLGESPELVDRAFKFERPGPMIFDKRGELWIIQRGNDYPTGNLLTAKYPAAVKCYRTDGTFTGRAITDVVNPLALGYDRGKDELLVGENSADLNVRIYAKLDSAPVLNRTFGEKGGIYSGAQPGTVVDAAAGDHARFPAIHGLGVDGLGNVYVGGGFEGTDLRSFDSAGKFRWMLNSHLFCNTYDVDPASDGTEVYATYNHLRLDLSRSDEQTPQEYVSYNWDWRNFGTPFRPSNSQAILRRLGPEHRLFMFTSGQGDVESFNIFRYDGTLAIPCGGSLDHSRKLWIDANGDGKPDPDEITKIDGTDISSICFFCVDANGDIWVTGRGITHFAFKGINAKGVPIYQSQKDNGVSFEPYPEEGAKVSDWGMRPKLDYDAARDIMVVYYPAVARKGDSDTSPAQYCLACYHDWSKGNRVSTWKIKNPDPQTDPGCFMYETKPYPFNLPNAYMGMQIAGDYLFMANLWGEVHVFDLATGKLVQILCAGPEVAGMCAWEDATLGLRAFKRSNGEYLIFTENSGWGGKNNLFRWKP